MSWVGFKPTLLLTTEEALNMKTNLKSNICIICYEITLTKQSSKSLYVLLELTVTNTYIWGCGMRKVKYEHVLVGKQEFWGFGSMLYHCKNIVSYIHTSVHININIGKNYQCFVRIRNNILFLISVFLWKCLYVKNYF